MKTNISLAVSAALMSLVTSSTVNSSDFISGENKAIKAIHPVSINKFSAAVIQPQKKFIVNKNDSTGIHTYIVKLKDKPLATYNGSISGLSATNPQITQKAIYKAAQFTNKSSKQIRDDLRLNLQSDAAQAYQQFLEKKQQTFIAKAEQKIGSGLTVIYQYKTTFNGLAVKLTQSEAQRLSLLSDVEYIEKEHLEHIETDTGPTLIGATSVWQGSGNNATNMGEGVIVGVIDTGINSDHPSFADIGGDGYDHTNPWGTGVYKGDCAVNFPELCNDKLIGIHHYDTITNNYTDTAVFGDTPPAANGEDYNGHGSHTASTAAGNILLNVPMLDGETDKVEGDGINSTGFSFSRISGVAPHANIVAFQICHPGEDGDTYSGCPSSAIIAALEDAVKDGVDVINFSISGGGDPWTNPSEQAFLAAQEAGIFAAVSAGNDGPDAMTTEKSAPWYTAVAAATHGREVVFDKSIGSFTGGDSTLPDITGKSATTGITASIVYAGDFNNPNDANGDSAQCLKPFPAGTFSGQIVVCDRGTIARVEKAVNVRDGGAGGYVLANLQGGATNIESDVFVIPGIQINADDGDALKAWLAKGTGHTATISASTGKTVIGQADKTASFSSRGPNSSVPDIMTPSVTAPGVSIYAAYSDQQFGHDQTTTDPSDFAFLQGTSMSSPHVAGAGAVLKSAHPTWTADNIRSALMLTATSAVTKEDGSTSADFFDMGAGRIRVDLATKTGLVMNETAANYTAANPALGGDPKTLNIPSVSNANCLAYCSWTRTVTATQDGVWNASTVAISDGLVINVSPASFSLTAGQSQRISIDVDTTNAKSNQWAFGQVKLTSTNFPDVNIPVSAKASSGNIPRNLTFTSHRNADSFIERDVKAVAISDFNTQSYGLIKATQQSHSLKVDSDNSSVYDDTTDGVYVELFTIPENAKRYVAEILTAEAADLDMFIGIDNNGDGIPQSDEEISNSASSTALEKISLMNPTAGNYWVLIQNWQASSEGATDKFTMATAIVNGDIKNSLSATADAVIPELTPFDLTFSWNLPDAQTGDRYYGAIALGTSSANAGNLGLVAVDLIRDSNDVSISNDKNDRASLNDVVNFQVNVLSNANQNDRDYIITATLPIGLTLDESSVVGGVISGNTITWQTNLPSLFGIPTTYDMTNNTNDNTCKLPDIGQGSGYIDLYALDNSLVPESITGNDQTAAFAIDTMFMGEQYQTLNVTEDGFIYFTGSQGSKAYENQLLPNSAAPNNLVAPLWRDNQIARTDTSGITVGSSGTDYVIVEFDKIKHWLGFADNASANNLTTPVADQADFEVVFNNATGDFYFAYDNITHDWGSSLGGTVGYEDKFGLTGRADIYAQSVYGGADAKIAAIEDIQNGLVMCYHLNQPSNAKTFTFAAQINPDFSGQNITVSVENSVNNGELASETTQSTVEIEVAPIAVIVAPTSVTEGNSVTLDGTQSSDANNDSLTYLWEQTAGTSVTFNTTAETTVFTAPSITGNSATLTFKLTVNDGHGNTAQTSHSITVNKKATVAQPSSSGSGGGSVFWLLIFMPICLFRKKL